MSPRTHSDSAKSSSAVNGVADSSPSSAGKPAPASRKRRASATGSAYGSGPTSRGVANLTPAQLAKKRANDREAQRAIRERTKNQIETLERRIQELTSQQPYQELQNAIRQKELVEAENAEIKRCLESVMDLIHPILSPTKDVMSESDAFPSLPGNTNHSLDDVTPAMQPNGQQHSRLDSQGSFHSSLPAMTYASTPGGSAGASPSTRPRPFYNAWNPSISRTPPGADAQSSRATPEERIGRPADLAPSLLRTTSAERLALGLLPVGRPEIQSSGQLVENRSMANTTALPADSHITLSTSRARSPNLRPMYRNPLPPRADYSTLPRHTPPSCPLDQLLLEFIAERRQRASEGLSETELIGPPYPDFFAILNQSAGPRGVPSSAGGGAPPATSSTNPVSTFFADILSTFPDIATVPEKTAVFYSMFHTMRWHCSPTSANFARLPPWLRPTPWQTMTPHPIWIDHLPWPDMRDELVRTHQRYPFENFFIPFTTTMSLNWPYPDEEVFAPRMGGGGGRMGGSVGGDADEELRLSVKFEEHLRKLENWSIGSQFARSFPLLVNGNVRIEEKGVGMVEGRGLGR